MWRVIHGIEIYVVGFGWVGADCGVFEVGEHFFMAAA
jgi:hypothetical protein